jgi:RNA exonuclease NGL2
MSKRFQLTPEQIALSEERKAKKQKLQSKPPTEANRALILHRPFINLQPVEDGICVKLLTWNLLAQCLVRRSWLLSSSRSTNVAVGRELFPTSNCLKGNQRYPMIEAEILALDADILCLQASLSFRVPMLHPTYVFPGGG